MIDCRPLHCGMNACFRYDRCYINITSVWSVCALVGSRRLFHAMACFCDVESTLQWLQFLKERNSGDLFRAFGDLVWKCFRWFSYQYRILAHFLCFFFQCCQPLIMEWNMEMTRYISVHWSMGTKPMTFTTTTVLQIKGRVQLHEGTVSLDFDCGGSHEGILWFCTAATSGVSDFSPGGPRCLLVCVSVICIIHLIVHAPRL